MIAPCELWGGKAIRNDNEGEAKVPPRKDRNFSYIINICSCDFRVLAGIHFSDNKEHLRDYARKNMSKTN
jgi:hypothetical protein